MGMLLRRHNLKADEQVQKNEPAVSVEKVEKVAEPTVEATEKPKRKKKED